MAFIEKNPSVKDYMPDSEEIPKAGKEWVAGMLQTLCKDDFSAYVKG